MSEDAEREEREVFSSVDDMSEISISGISWNDEFNQMAITHY